MKKILVLLFAFTACAGPIGAQTFDTPIRFVYKLHGQTRRFDYTFTHSPSGGIKLSWTIERNLKLWHGSYTMSPEAVEKGTELSLLQPDDGNHVNLPANATFAIIPRTILNSLKKAEGTTLWDGRIWTIIRRNANTLETRADDGTTMTVLDNPNLPIILRMENNTDEVNWRMEH